MAKKLFIGLVLMATFAATSAFASDPYIELLKEDVRAEKKAIIEEVMEFSDVEAMRFWRVYNEYDRQLGMIWKDRVRMIKDFAKHYGAIDDKKAAKIADTAFRLESRRTNLKRKFFPRFSKAVGAKRTAQFFQLERSINLLIEIQIAAELPLLD